MYKWTQCMCNFPVGLYLGNTCMRTSSIWYQFGNSVDYVIERLVFYILITNLMY